MTSKIRNLLALLLIGLTIVACSSTPRDPFNDPDAQRDRSKDAQDEMRRDTSRY